MSQELMEDINMKKSNIISVSFIIVSLSLLIKLFMLISFDKINVCLNFTSDDSVFFIEMYISIWVNIYSSWFDGGRE